ncbi:MAG: ATP-dependent helicase [Janthinobacterium lividum]
MPDSPLNSSDPNLTEEQRAIVVHDYGPALVFAVAGAGKTTAMTYRIERLVRENIFPASSILATSFSKASVKDIKTALGRWPHCAKVQVQTLHAVGWGILRLAQRRGLGREFNLGQEDDSSDSQLLGKVLGMAWRDKVPYAAELDGLDRPDFLTYVGVMKANLLYAELAQVELPPPARAQAGQAPAPQGFSWYPALYALYEKVRVQEHILTFDDMLLSAWEYLHRFPEVLQDARKRFGCILVDEFQDVNRVQSEILDLLTFPNRHYMAIGDDDQTIYEWRGADPGFILNFTARYGASKYFIHDNFRSHAAPLALANRVIVRNQKREPKSLSLTRGFGGRLEVHEETSPETQGQHLAQLIRQALDSGHTPDEIAVLVRLYAQTPPLEQGLLEADIPYRVVGSSPFYARPEVKTLLDYVRLARMEDGWETRWSQLANKPARYLPRTFCDALIQTVRRGVSFPNALMAAAKDAPAHMAARLGDLAETLHWLRGASDTLPAGAALTQLDKKIGYLEFLRRSSGFPETGMARAANVEAFLRYAHSSATLTGLLTHLDTLAASGVGLNRSTSDGIALLTVFRAKGLQWPVVFVPDCNQGIFPYGGPEELEKERRLFYVALTRTQSDLHLHLVKTELPSQFLVEADWKNTLAAVQSLGTTLTRPPSSRSTGDVLSIIRHTSSLQLGRYFGKWHQSLQSQAAADQVHQLFAAAQERGLDGPLGLTPAHLAPWSRFGSDHPQDPDAFADLAEHMPTLPQPTPQPSSNALRIGGRVQHNQHGIGTILAIRGDRLSPRLEIQFSRGKPVVLPAKFVELTAF